MKFRITKEFLKISFKFNQKNPTTAGEIHRRYARPSDSDRIFCSYFPHRDTFAMTPPVKYTGGK